jgi:5-formyltetrahydrofolate cyclo-ligase
MFPSVVADRTRHLRKAFGPGAGMDDIRLEKKRLRSEALARRDGLSAQYRIEASLHLAEAAGGFSFDPGTPVSGFLPIRSEIDLRPLMAALAARGARLCLPVVASKSEIVFRELVRGAPLVDTGFGTVGPGPQAEVLLPRVMLVPLAAFDAQGNRIGYGAGYYDRYIAMLRQGGIEPDLTGIAFDCQEVARVPAEAHDVPLPRILTESGLRNFAGAGLLRP